LAVRHFRDAAVMRDDDQRLSHFAPDIAQHVHYFAAAFAVEMLSAEKDYRSAGKWVKDIRG
jgi:hypothetical protein